ncbi:hypothetical protein Tco_0598416 [Tanacetum coccineum]
MHRIVDHIGASINLMPYSVWKDLALPELTPTCMTLELADRFNTEPIVLLKYVPSNDVYEGEITLRVGKEAITFNLDQTSKYTADYDHMTANKIDVIEWLAMSFLKKVLGFSKFMRVAILLHILSHIVSYCFSKSHSFYGDSDFLLIGRRMNHPPPNHEQYMPGGRKELKLCEAKTVESSVNEPPEVELKELPPHLEYAFLEGDDKLPVIIAKDLKDEEKAALLKVLKSHKRAIAWKLSEHNGCLA